MARPNKEGLEYFSLDTDITNDDKIKLIKAKHGIVGFAIVVLLLTKIYHNGYYYQWSEDERYLLADDSRTDITIIDNVVSDCINKGLFNKDLYEKFGILTSRGIQKRFIKACYRRNAITLFREYFLAADFVIATKIENILLISVNVDNNRPTDVVSVDNNPATDVVSDGLMSTLTTQSKGKESKEKVKEIERKESARAREDNQPVDNFKKDGDERVKPDLDNPDFVLFWDKYPKHKDIEEAMKAWDSLVVQGVPPKYIIQAAVRYAGKEKVKGTDTRYMKAPQNFLTLACLREFLPTLPDCPRCRGSGGALRDLEDGGSITDPCDCWSVLLAQRKSAG